MIKLKTKHMKIKKINKCRCCGSKKLNLFLDFGDMHLTTEFPTRKTNKGKIPMKLMICQKCKLFQLLHNYDLNKLYNKDYGYKSGINESMNRHLESITQDVEKIINFTKNDIVLDIASNDGTLLKKYKNKKITRFGIDPTIKKFLNLYPKNFLKFPSFFNKESYNKITNFKKAKVITSIAVFYDIQDPVNFISDIKAILDKDGVWILEQSYFPLLIKNNAYDSICHEHLSYFMHRQIKNILSKFDMHVFNVTFNHMNGGSVRFFISHKSSAFKIDKKNVEKIIKIENRIFINFSKIINNFKKSIYKSRVKLVDLVKKINKQKKIIHVYGASTKGNVILQFCKLTKEMIPFAAERNKDKFGRFTPGTSIPIISEKESREKSPDYYLVMPWHFKKEILHREKSFLKKGGKIIFPLPNIKIIG
jgi:hypothetical protein